LTLILSFLVLISRISDSSLNSPVLCHPLPSPPQSFLICLVVLALFCVFLL